MTFENSLPHSSDALSLTELELYHLIMDYRAQEGLAPIPLSENLTTTAGRHAADTLYNIWEAGLTLPADANLHSWSNAFYYADHSNPSVMWDAPERIGTSYTSNGYEISAAGYADIAAALAGWQGSTGHDTVIVNEGAWASATWNAIGIGVENDSSVSNYGGRIYHVWFGTAEDLEGAPEITGTAAANEITGTAFADKIRGLGGDDKLIGDAGRDILIGNQGDDKLVGGRGRDRLNGGQDDDILKGGGGRDILNGGQGNDTLQGGNGVDLFVFKQNDFGRDRIRDYSGDKVRITAEGEASTLAELNAALREKANGDVIYDHLNDGENVIVFKNITLADLDLTLFDLG
ncbi:hypothetical protein [Pseudooceanicola sp.]|uniref:hypothetical protein n=1 Tax=Pseudooceanicola sp. TaxID=1914328 RepID=UPI00351200C4